MSELFEITVRGTTRYLTSGRNIVMVQGNTYSPAVISRSAITISGADTGDSRVTITMDRYHELIQECNRYRVLPDVSILDRIGQVMIRGAVNKPIELRTERGAGVARMEVVPIQQQLLRGNYQNILWQSRCNWVLYSSIGCRVDRTQYSMRTTVASVSSRRVRLASVTGVPALRGASAPSQYFQGGVIRRVSDNARRHVQSQIGTSFTLHNNFTDLAVGETVEISAGCNHSLDHCTNKFGNNQIRFGGHPTIPFRDPAPEIQRRT